MFRKLHIILIIAVLVVVGFFVVTSMSFSSRYEEGPYYSPVLVPTPYELQWSSYPDFAAKTCKYRWWLIDGYLSILFLLVFTAIAFLWRPTGNNRR
jgi:hypothetical protein